MCVLVSGHAWNLRGMGARLRGEWHSPHRALPSPDTTGQALLGQRVEAAARRVTALSVYSGIGGWLGAGVHPPRQAQGRACCVLPAGRGLCSGSSLPALEGPVVVWALGPSLWEAGVVPRQGVPCEDDQGGGEPCAWPGRSHTSRGGGGWGRGGQHRDSAGQRSPRGPVGRSALPSCRGSPCPWAGVPSSSGGLSAAGRGRSAPSRAEAELGGRGRQPHAPALCSPPAPLRGALLLRRGRPRLGAALVSCLSLTPRPLPSVTGRDRSGGDAGLEATPSLLWRLALALAGPGWSCDWPSGTDTSRLHCGFVQLGAFCERGSASVSVGLSSGGRASGGQGAAATLLRKPRAGCVPWG